MKKRLRAILLSLPMLSIGAASAIAAAQNEAENISPTVSAPTHEQAAMPAGCNGCADHDCATCPLAIAAAQALEAPPPTAAEIRCGSN